MMTRSIRTSLAFVSMMVLAVCLYPSVARAQTVTVTWVNERLTIVATDASLAAVLAEVGRQTGTTFVGLNRVTGNATIEIRDALLLDALTTLLRRTEYVMTAPVNADARVVVWLEGRGANQVADAATRTARADVPSPSQPDEADEPTQAVDPSLPYNLAASREFRARPSAAEAETARLTATGLISPDAPESSLLATVKSADPGVRIRALEMLAIQNTSAGRQALNHALDDPNPFVRGEALTFLLSLGASPEAVRGVSDLLTHQDPAVRVSAALALGEESSDEAEFQLKRALNDDDPAVKSMAAQLLKEKEEQRRQQEEQKRNGKRKP